MIKSKIIGLTVGVLLTMTACGAKITGINKPLISNIDSANVQPSVPVTPIPSNDRAELPNDSSKIPTVTYCEMIKNSAGYDRKIVRVRGVYFNGFEQMFFFDEHCVAGEPPRAGKNIPAETWIEWDDDFVRKDDSAEAKKYHAVKSGERKDVTVVGRFYGTRDINNTGSGKYQFRVMRVEKVSDLAD